jgi:hypothetical protein
MKCDSETENGKPVIEYLFDGFLPDIPKKLLIKVN